MSPYSNMAGELERYRNKHKGRRPSEDESRGWRDNVYKPRNAWLVDCQELPKVRRKTWNRFSLTACRRPQPTGPLISDFWPSNL